jgi:hypothetical protein
MVEKASEPSCLARLRGGGQLAMHGWGRGSFLGAVTHPVTAPTTPGHARPRAVERDGQGPISSERVQSAGAWPHANATMLCCAVQYLWEHVRMWDVRLYVRDVLQEYAALQQFKPEQQPNTFCYTGWLGDCGSAARATRL